MLKKYLSEETVARHKFNKNKLRNNLLAQSQLYENIIFTPFKKKRLLFSSCIHIFLFVHFSFSFFILAMLCCLWDFSSLARDQTQGPSSESES